MATTSREITRTELKTWLAEQREFVLIDVSLAEDYAAEHLPEALNAAVYEVTFLQQVGALEPLKGSLVGRVLGGSDVNVMEPVVVYGSSEKSQASLTAAQKLTAAGFSQVFDFRGGLTEWKAAGFPIEGKGETASGTSAVADGAHHLDLEASEFEWTGRSLGGKHSGTLEISSGEVVVENGELVGGRIVLDMTSIENRDIDDSELRQTLHAHLASDDFFDAARYPEAIFEIEGSEKIADVSAGSPNLRVRGRLTLKGVAQTLEFPAVAGVGAEGALIARAHFDIDRTRWNVIYGSGKFYEKLGQHLVQDLITIDLKMVTA